MKVFFALTAIFVSFSVFAQADRQSHSFIFASSVGGLAQDSDDEVLSCETQPGRMFCRRVARFESVLLDCFGQGCPALYRTQIVRANEIYDWYQSEFHPDMNVASDVLDVVLQAEGNLCSYELAADPSIREEQQIAFNSTLDVFQEILRAAGVDRESLCRFL